MIRPRIRSLKPEAFQHRKVGRLSDRAFRLWVGMLCQADDHGRLVADIDQLRVLIFGYQDGVKGKHVQQALEEVGEGGLVRLYRIDGLQYADFLPGPITRRLTTQRRLSCRNIANPINPRAISRALARILASPRARTRIG